MELNVEKYSSFGGVGGYDPRTTLQRFLGHYAKYFKKMTKQIEAKELQVKLIQHWETLKTTKLDFKKGLKKNPYPIGTTNVLKLIKTGTCSPRTYFLILDFFEEIEAVKEKDNPV